MSTYHWSYEDLLGNYDFWMPFNGNDNADTTAAMTLTKVAGTNNFATDTIKSNTQVLLLDNSTSNDPSYYTYTGTPNAIDANAQYSQGVAFEFWIKIDSLPTSDRLFLKNSIPGMSDWQIYLTSTGGLKIEWVDEDGGVYNQTGADLSLNTWQLVTITTSVTTGGGSRSNLYVNGICKNTSNASQYATDLGINKTFLLYFVNDGSETTQIKIANFVQWINNVPSQREIVNRYQYLNSKTNYNTYVGADNPKLWLTSNTTMGTLAANVWSLTPNPGPGLSFRTDGRWEGSTRQTSPWTAQWDHAVTFGTLPTAVSDWFYNGNWSIEFWHKNDSGITNFTAANQHFAFYGTNPFCIIRNVANSYLPGFTVRYGNTAITPTRSTTTDANILNRYLDGEWHHYVLTSEWDSVSGNGTLKLYFDGNLEISQTFNRVSLTKSESMTNMGIGFISASGSMRNNSYDDLVLYDTVLTQSDVLDRYYAELMYERDVRVYQDNVWKIAKNTLTYDGTCWVDWDRYGSTKYWNGTAWTNL
jgi:hypothetical protein